MWFDRNGLAALGNPGNKQLLELIGRLNETQKLMLYFHQ
jgi:hypothetical protein